MSLQFNCPTCKMALLADDDMAGRDIRCPGCQAVFPVPKSARLQSDPPPISESQPADDEPPLERRFEDSEEPEAQPRPRRRRRRPPPPPSGRGPLFWIAIVFGVLFIGSCACCGGGYLLLPGENWHHYQSPEGGFAVDLPAPAKKNMPIPGLKPEPGEKVEGTILWKRGEIYAIMYSDILPAHQRAATDDEILNEAIKEMRSDPESKVVRTDSIKVSGFPGREIEYLYEDGGTYTGRIVVSDSRIYVVISGGRFVRPGNTNIRRFLDSFELLTPARGNGPRQNGR